MKNIIFIFVLLVSVVFASFSSQFVSEGDTFHSTDSNPEVIGISSEGREILVDHYGTFDSDIAVVLMGGIHGTYERNTVELMQEFKDYFSTNGADISLYIIETWNPDALHAVSDRSRDSSTGYINGEKVGELWTRYNSNFVDLNRNWDTSSWKSDFNYLNLFREGSGGSFPMSENETRAISYFMIRESEHYETFLVINYHSYRYIQSDTGMAQPSYTGHWRTPEVNETANIASKVYVEASRTYEHLEKWTRYEVPGEFLNWAGDNGFSAFDVELPNQKGVHDSQRWGETHYETNLRSVLAVIDSL